MNKPLALGLAALSIFSSTGGPASAQEAHYPSKPITVLVGYPPGGSTDLTGRAVADQLSRKLGVPVGSSRVDLQACKLEYSIVSPK